jgi:hypothetical protein
MKSFEDRQKGFEAAFQRDQELASGSQPDGTGFSDYGRPGGLAWRRENRPRPMQRMS